MSERRNERKLGGFARAASAVALIAVFAGGSTFASAPEADPAATRTLPAPPAGGQQGFVVDHFWHTFEDGKDDCPTGPARMLRETLIASLTPAEREVLLRPGNETQFQARYRQHIVRPDGSDICTNLERFDHPAQKTGQGTVAAGFDLDGDSAGKGTANTCAHANFTGRDGQRGVDNQFWRAFGCMAQNRPHEGTPPVGYKHFGMSLANGENAQVLVVRGIDSWKYDDKVEIIYANTPDRAVVGPSGKFLHGASYAVGKTPGGPNLLTGRIVDGVIEASAPQLRLRMIYYLGRGLRGEDLSGTRTQWDFTSVKLRLVLQPDGSLKGMLAGYEPVDNTMTGIRLGGAGAALTADFDCPSIAAAVRAMADGDRDPATGRCRRISSTLDISAVPAHVTNLNVPMMAQAAR